MKKNKIISVVLIITGLFVLFGVLQSYVDFDKTNIIQSAATTLIGLVLLIGGLKNGESK